MVTRIDRLARSIGDLQDTVWALRANGVTLGATEQPVNAGGCPKGFPADVFKTARRKLAAVDAATVLDDLASPPGHRLEALKGDRAGQHAIRINDRWRVCFTWGPAGPEDVEIVDYH